MPGLERGLRHPVTAEVASDEPELPGERAVILPGPAEVVLRPAVEEQDRRPVWPAPLAHMEPQAAATPHGVCLHPADPRLAVVCHGCHRWSPCTRRLDQIVAAGARWRIGRSTLFFPPAVPIFASWGAYG